MKRLTAIALLALAMPLAAQSPPGQADATAAVSGVVVDGATDQPLANTAVVLTARSAAGTSQRRQYTDAEGRFVFVNLPPALDYQLRASMLGYFPGGHSRAQGPSTDLTSLAVRPGEWVRDLRIVMWKPGSISGRVTDADGEPMTGVWVRALRRVGVAGHEYFVPMRAFATDDRGHYRIAGLEAGQYLVQVPSVQGPPPVTPPSPSRALDPAGQFPVPPSPSADGRPRTYPPVFHPGSRSLSAALPVEVSLAEERIGVDVTMQAVPAFTIAGRLEGPTESLTLRLLSAEPGPTGIGSEVSAAAIEADGSFVFMNVPEGQYVIDARRTVSEFRLAASMGGTQLPRSVPTTGFGSSTMTLPAAAGSLQLAQTQYGTNRNASDASARWPISVAEDQRDLRIPLQPAGVMDGVVVFEDPPPATPAAARVSVRLEPADGDPLVGAPMAASALERTFHLGGLAPGAYVLRVPSTTWIVRSITWNGEDHTTAPFDATSRRTFDGVRIVLTNRGGSVAGTVAAPDSAVILAPADPREWRDAGLAPPRMRDATVDADGGFRFTGLPGGDYLIAAVPARERSSWNEPGYLERFARVAKHITVPWGESISVSLTLIAVPR
jgi:hypothetical protein